MHEVMLHETKMFGLLVVLSTPVPEAKALLGDAEERPRAYRGNKSESVEAVLLKIRVIHEIDTNPNMYRMFLQ